MKIGIMTFWNAEDNYGQILQCYALQKYLINLGHDAYLIKYDRHGESQKKMIQGGFKLKYLNIIKIIKIIILKIKIYLAKRKNKMRKFHEFKEKYIKQTDITYLYKDLKLKPPDADAYIVGSDQVWNFSNDELQNARSNLHAFFLDFGKNNIQRLSYAASFCSKVLPKEFINEITPLLQRFNYVSVREQEGLEICRQCSISNAELVIDPTFLLKAEEYRSLYLNENVKIPNRPYILLYILGYSINTKVIKNIIKYAKLLNLQIIYITGHYRFDKYYRYYYYATIPEWLGLIDNAEIVITNSFHGCAFSLIFNKKFAVIPFNKKLEDQNSRFNSLSELFQYKINYITENNYDIISKLDIPNVSFDLFKNNFNKILSESDK